MRNFNTLLLLFLLTVVFVGCDKENDKDKEPTKEQLLMAKNWNPTVINASANIAGNKLDFDYYSQLKSCQKDNFLKFESGGKVTLNEGASKCNTSDPQTLQGTWSLNNNLLTIEGNVLKTFNLNSATPLTLTIQELTNQTLKVTTTQPVSYPGIPTPINATFDITFAGL